jgi:hypothetical protein
MNYDWMSNVGLALLILAVLWYLYKHGDDDDERWGW